MPAASGGTNPLGTGGMGLLAMARCGAKQDRLEAEPAALGSCLHTQEQGQPALKTTREFSPGLICK